MTTFGDGVFQYGGVPVPFGAPFGVNSKAYFVAPYRTTSNGASDGNDGKTPGRALKTIAAAYAKCRDNYNDVIYLLGSGASAAETTDDLTATLTWAKDMVHLVGVNGGERYSSRCRIGTQTTGITPLVDVTASDCLFANIQAFHGVTGDTTGLICWRDSGNRNVYSKVHFAGGGITGTATDTGMRSFKLAGGGERVFKDCVFGIDTVSRTTTANAELEFAGAVRETFDECTFVTYGSGSHAMVIVTATGLDRHALFRRCQFINPIQSATTALTECFSCTAGTSPNGAVILHDPLAYGCGPWEADVETGRVIVLGNVTPAGTDGAGLAGPPESP